MIKGDLVQARWSELLADARAVRAEPPWCALERPASVRPGGDTRSCSSDGTIEGFVGGHCAGAERAHARHCA